MSDFPPPPPPPGDDPTGGGAPPPPPPPPPPYGGQPQYGQQYGQQQYGQYAAGGYGGAPVGSPPNNFLVPAILVTLFCCLPAGIVSIVYAAQVNSKWTAGDVAGAQTAAKNAKTWTFVSLGVGLVFIVLYVMLMIFGVMAGSTGSEF